MVAFDYCSFFDKFPVLKLETIQLRELTQVDSEDYFEMMSNHHVIKYIADDDVPVTLEEAKKELKFWSNLFCEKKTVFWAITEFANNRLIGTIGYNYWNRHNQTAEVSYDLSQRHWGQGIMTNILATVLKFGFYNMNLNKIEAKTVCDNLASQKVLLKAGFQRNGVLEKYRTIRQCPRDVYTYHLMRSEFLKNDAI